MKVWAGRFSLEAALDAIPRMHELLTMSVARDALYGIHLIGSLRHEGIPRGTTAMFLLRCRKSVALDRVDGALLQAAQR